MYELTIRQRMRLSLPSLKVSPNTIVCSTNFFNPTLHKVKCVIGQERMRINPHVASYEIRAAIFETPQLGSSSYDRPGFFIAFANNPKTHNDVVDGIYQNVKFEYE